MNRIVAAFLLLLASTASGLCQIPGEAEIQLHRTPITGGAVVGDCLTVGTGNTVSQAVCGSGSVTTFSAGSTGFTPGSATSGAVTLAGILNGANGGSGVNNSGKTITLGGNLTTSGAFASTFTMTAATGVTFPTSGTLLSSASTIPLTVGTTTIASGTTTRILYDNAGVIGEYTLTGSGTVAVMQNTPTLITPVLGTATGTKITLTNVFRGANATQLDLTADGNAYLIRNDGTTGALIKVATASTFNFRNVADNADAAITAGAVTFSNANVLMTALGNTATTSAVCYNTGTGLLTYNSTIGTCTVSTITAKDLDEPLEPRQGLALVMAMRPWVYHLKPDRPTYMPGAQIGMIAEYARDVDPRLVAVNADGSVAGFRYEQYTAALTAAVQELKREVNELKAPKSAEFP